MSVSLSTDFQSQSGPRSSGYALLVIALLVTTLAYVGTLRFDFAYDDGPQIIANPTLTSFHYLPSLFLGHTWKFMLPQWPGNYYRPLFMSWLLLNRVLFGLNPAPWHATTLAVHLIATGMVFVAARQLLGSGTQAGFAALLFGLHPIHIESVAWISGVTDPLMTIFVLVSLWAWIRGDDAQQHRGWWRLLSVVSYILGCFTKETALPLVVVVILYYFFVRQERGIFRCSVRVWPLWIAAGLYLIVRFVALRGLIHPLGASLHDALLSVPIIIWEYMRRLLLPLGLSVFYDIFPVTRIWDLRFWLPLLGLIVAAALACRMSKRFRLIPFSLAWILLFLSPVILGLPVFLVGEWVHDRYLYLPSFGLCLLLGYFIDRLPQRRKLFGYGAASVAVVVPLAAIMAFATAWQQQYWSNSLLLFVHAVKVAPNNPWSRGSLAGELFRAGDRENARWMYEQAIRVDPDNWKNNADYGNMLYKIGEYREADAHYTRALIHDSEDPNAHFNQGLSRLNYGNYTGAVASLEEALRRNPKLRQGHYWLGYALEKTGRLDEARCEYELEIRTHSDMTMNAQERLQSLSAEKRTAPIADVSCAVRQ